MVARIRLAFPASGEAITLRTRTPSASNRARFSAAIWSLALRIRYTTGIFMVPPQARRGRSARPYLFFSPPLWIEASISSNTNLITFGTASLTSGVSSISNSSILSTSTSRMTTSG